MVMLDALAHPDETDARCARRLSIDMAVADVNRAMRFDAGPPHA
jgi:hypothetical protein